MNILTPLQTGLSGVSRGLENLQQIAADIAQAGTDKSGSLESTTELTQSLVDLQSQKQATLAATKVVAAADEVLNALLDTNA